MRVLIDWVIELFFPRDIVQTIDISDPVAHNKSPVEQRPEDRMRSAARS